MSRCMNMQIVQILYISIHVTVWSSFKRHFFLSLNLNSCAEAFLASFFDLLNQLELCSKQLSYNYLYILYVLLVGDIEVKSLLSCMRQNKQKQFAQLILKIYFYLFIKYYIGSEVGSKTGEDLQNNLDLDFLYLECTWILQTISTFIF